VTEIHDDGLADQLLEAARRHDFEPSRQVLEIYGLCSDCRQDARQ
jgi:Fur family transcriptional regulator, zinc uptake regulator